MTDVIRPDGVMERLVAMVEPKDIAALRVHIEQERRAAAADDTASLIRLSGGFHLALADLVGSDFLSSTMRDLIARASLITAVYRDTAQFDCGPDEHKAIVDRLEAGDAQSAAALMIEHLNHIESVRPWLRISEYVFGKSIAWVAMVFSKDQIVASVYCFGVR